MLFKVCFEEEKYECVEGNNTTNIQKEHWKNLGSMGEMYDLDQILTVSWKCDNSKCPFL